MGARQARTLLALSLEPQRVADLGLATPGDPRRSNLSTILGDLQARQLVERHERKTWALARGYHVDDALDAAFEVLYGGQNAAD